MPRSKANDLLRRVLNRSLSTMEETTTRIAAITALALEYQRLLPDINKRIRKILKSIQDAQKGTVEAVSVNVKANNDEDSLKHVRFMLESFVVAFLESTRMNTPHIYTSLNSIDWRALFHIHPEPIVKVAVVPPSDEDSGEASVGSVEVNIDAES